LPNSTSVVSSPCKRISIVVAIFGRGGEGRGVQHVKLGLEGKREREREKHTIQIERSNS